VLLHSVIIAYAFFVCYSWDTYCCVFRQKMPFLDRVCVCVCGDWMETHTYTAGWSIYRLNLFPLAFSRKLVLAYVSLCVSLSEPYILLVVVLPLQFREIECSQWDLRCFAITAGVCASSFIQLRPRNMIQP